jgi:hypothetical protein
LLLAHPPFLSTPLTTAEGHQLLGPQVEVEVEKRNHMDGDIAVVVAEGEVMQEMRAILEMLATQVILAPMLHTIVFLLVQVVLIQLLLGGHLVVLLLSHGILNNERKTIS